MSPIKFLPFIFMISMIAAPHIPFADTSSDEKIVSEAIEAIEMCYHWGGEVGDNDKERQIQIEQGFDRDCPIAASKAKVAYQKFPNNAELINSLFQLMDIGYFDVSSETKKEMCEKSAMYYKKRFDDSALENVLYEVYCPEQSKLLYKK